MCSRCILRTFNRSHNLRKAHSIASQTNDGISSALLKRARALASEHATLSANNAERFEAKTARKIGELRPIANAVREWEKASEVYILFHIEILLLTRAVSNRAQKPPR